MIPMRLTTNPNNQDQTSVDILLSTDANGVENWMPMLNYRKMKKDTYGYFLNILEMSAELCLGRNGEALDNL